jgi:peptidoglycan hydrolase FlgJ
MDRVSPLSTSANDAATAAGQALRRTGDLDRSIGQKQGVQKQAVEFEAVYLTQMLKPMFEDLKTAEPFGGGFGEDVWRSLQVQEFGRALAQGGGVGLADAVARQLLRVQEQRGGEHR